MNARSVRLRYRPLRLGWCILKGDIEAFRRSVLLSFTMWGGQYNPIIPVDDNDIAEALVKLFRVDDLIRMSQGSEVGAFIQACSYLPASNGGALFAPAPPRGKIPLFVDIRHPLVRLQEQIFKINPGPESGLDLYEWEVSDQLADVFLCTYGQFPSANAVGMDYKALAQTSLYGARNIIQNGGEVQMPDPARETIASINRAYMQRHHAVRGGWDQAGFYVGDAEDFDDLVNFWNLRAADTQLEFFDPRYAYRLRHKSAHWATTVRQAPPRPNGPQGLALWHRTERSIDDARQEFGVDGLTFCGVSASTWNGVNVRPPIMCFGYGTALASVDESSETAAMSFALTDTPFVANRDTELQRYVLSVDSGMGSFLSEQATFHTPFIPELNQFYGDKALWTWNVARSEPDALGIVTRISRDHYTLRAINIPDLIRAIFGTVGIEVTPSKPGLIASTLIRQMGGLDGCQVFKIVGVRTLIERHAPHQPFDRGAAMLTILGQGEDRPLSDYQQVYIEPREVGSKLKNGAVLSYLLEKGVFRAGLNFQCPSCQLEFWRSLDDARSRLECEYCGHDFKAAPQLRDKGWAFRRSGLFGNYDHQEGAIPVLLTLQQLTENQSGNTIFSTAMTLKSKTAATPECETDFVIITENEFDHRVQIAIGEAKTRTRITVDDVAKLKAVADAFPKDRYKVYVVFARLSPFSNEEVEHIRQVNGPDDSRAIMLTDRELEPLSIYERTAKEFDISFNPISFEDMVIGTIIAFFEQRTRVAPAPVEQTPGS